MRASAILLVATGPLRLARGHGQMLIPYPWQDKGGLAGMRLVNHGMNVAGCSQPIPGVDSGSYKPCTHQWYTNNTRIPGSPTLPAEMRTWQDEFKPGRRCDYTLENPWRAPGTARVDSPCGIFGGNPSGCPPGNPSHDGCQGGGWGRGPDARSVHFDYPMTTEWVRGSEVEAIWSIMANHGGGYSYRLCKRPKDGDTRKLEESCFQQTVLDFVGDTQWLQFGNNDWSNRLAFKARRTRTGTTPAGSQWTRNPVPAFNCPSGGSAGNVFDGINDDHRCRDPQFPPPCDGCWGFGTHGGVNNKSRLMFGIVDKLRVPQDLPDGEYVLSWRWDCEQTPQIWTTCANVKIVEKASPNPNQGLGECSICRGGPSQLQEHNTAGCGGNGHCYSCYHAQLYMLNPAQKNRCSSLAQWWRSKCCAGEASLAERPPTVASEPMLDEAAERALVAMAGTHPLPPLAPAKDTTLPAQRALRGAFLHDISPHARGASMIQASSAQETGPSPSEDGEPAEDGAVPESHGAHSEEL